MRQNSGLGSGLTCGKTSGYGTGGHVRHNQWAMLGSVIKWPSTARLPRLPRGPVVGKTRTRP